MNEKYTHNLDEDMLKQAFRKNQTNQKDEQIKLSKEEADKFEKAFEQKEFRDLMAEYVSEISNPKHRAEQEQYLRQLEEQNELPDGKDIIRPQPGFVMKFKYSKKSSDSKSKDKEKLFINIVHSKQVDQPKYTSASMTDKHGKSGRNWSIPFTFGPMRMENDNKKTLIPTFDCCFHPLALVYASKSVPYRDLIAETVREGVTRQFKTMNNESIDINQQYLVLKGTQYKNGKPPAMMIKTVEKSASSLSSNRLGKDNKKQVDGIDGHKWPEMRDYSMKKGFLLKQAKTKRKTKSNGGGRNTIALSNKKDGFGRGGGKTREGDTIPSYDIIERGEFDLTDHNIQGLNRPSTRPKFLLIRIKLPGIKSVKRIELNISKERLALKSFHSHPIYNLCIILPYPVMSDDGSAKFEKEKCTLTINLPVCRPDIVTPWSRYDEEEKHEGEEQVNDYNSKDIATLNDLTEEESSISSSPILVEKEEARSDLNESPVIVEKLHNHSRWLNVNIDKDNHNRELFARDGVIPTLPLPSEVTLEKKESNAESLTDTEFSCVSNDDYYDGKDKHGFHVVKHSNYENDDEDLNESKPAQQQSIQRSNIIFELD